MDLMLARWISLEIINIFAAKRTKFLWCPFTLTHLHKHLPFNPTNIISSYHFIVLGSPTVTTLNAWHLYIYTFIHSFIHPKPCHLLKLFYTQNLMCNYYYCLSDRKMTATVTIKAITARERKSERKRERARGGRSSERQKERMKTKAAKKNGPKHT